MRKVEMLPDKRQREYLLAFSDYEDLPPYIEDSPLCTPYEHSSDEYDHLVRVQSALQKGCLALLSAAPNDERLQTLLSPRLDEEVVAKFESLDNVPLAPQFIRPDYIYDREGQPRICEINTRFIFNGNIASVHMAEYLEQSHDIDIIPYFELDEFMHQTYDGENEEDPTLFVQASETEHDILLQKQRSLYPASVSPEALKLLDPKKVGRMVIELHQHELSKAFDDVASLMKEGIPAYNDPRVVHLLHDKRLLVPLSDKEYMQGLIGAEDASVLEEGIVPSFHPAWEGREPECIDAKSAMAKGAISGKGDNLNIVRLATYNDRLGQPNEYVFQPKLPQPKIELSDGVNAEIAGTLPMTLEGEVFGPGIVRVLPYRKLHGFLGFSIAVRGEA